MILKENLTHFDHLPKIYCCSNRWVLQDNRVYEQEKCMGTFGVLHGGSLPTCTRAKADPMVNDSDSGMTTVYAGERATVVIRTHTRTLGERLSILLQLLLLLLLSYRGDEERTHQPPPVFPSLLHGRGRLRMARSRIAPGACDRFPPIVRRPR